MRNPNLNPNFYLSQTNQTHSAAVHLSTLFNPNLVGEVSFGYSQFHENDRYNTAGQYDIVNGILGIKGLSQNPDAWEAPGWYVSGYSGFGQGGSQPRQWQPTNIEFRPAFSWIHGKHNIKFGGEIMKMLDTFKEIVLPVGYFTYDGTFTNNALADFLTAHPNFAETSPQPFEPEQRYSQWAGYFQDDWKATPRLTLNLGLRYEYASVPRSSNNSFSNIYFGPNNAEPVIVVSKNVHPVVLNGDTYPLLTIAPYAQASTVGLPDSLIFSDKKDFSPRVGFAYLLPGLKNTILF